MDTDHSLLTAEIPHLRRYARFLFRDPHAADDLVQSCLERALGRLHLWQRDKKMRPWLFTIMHNLYVSSVRSDFARPVMVPLTDMNSSSMAAGQEAGLDAQRTLAAVERLPEDQRLPLLLIGVEEMSYREAAEVLGIPVGTLMSRLHRGREELRRSLGMTKPAPVLHRVK
jgi:RNA polymerase sigma-70 factor (ECF subfamily)